MNRQLLENYVNEVDNPYVYVIGHYKIPTYTLQYEQNLKEYRKYRLENPSPKEEDFERVLYPKLKENNKCIKEFPILIDDKDLWISCLEEVGLRPIGYNEREFFCIDFFFPKVGLAVEIDSDYHRKGTHESYDEARDHYLWKRYHIRTLRSDPTGINKKFLNEFYRTYKEILKWKSMYGIKEIIPLDYSNYNARSWEKQNKDLVVLFEYLESEYLSGYYNSPYIQILTISIEEALKYSVGRDLKEIERIFSMIYGIQLIIIKED